MEEKFAPLARDQHGNRIPLPDNAELWLVQRQTAGRPATVRNADGEPLHIPLSSNKPDLCAHGCSGSIRLVAVDKDLKPVNTSVAFVELGEEAIVQRAAPAIDNGDLVRASMETFTRVMEAMQRAQVERERALAEKEKALIETQVARERMHVDLIAALVERSSGGKVQDPVAVLKQQLAFQKTLDHETERRNAGALPLPPLPANNDPPSKWLAFAPTAAALAQDLLVRTLSKGDPQAAAEWNRTIAMWGQFIGQAVGGATPQMPQPGAPSLNVDSTGQSAHDDSDDEEEARPMPPKPVRRLMALLEDEEASAFHALLGQIDAEQLARFSQVLESLGTDEARLTWARGLLRGEIAQPAEVPSRNAPEVNVTSQPPSMGGIGDIHPQLIIPVLTQLSDEEKSVAIQLAQVLNRGTLQQLSERLLGMAPERALKTIRDMIHNERLRRASAAHRAVAAALRAEDESRPNGSTARPNGAPSQGGES